jgi:cytochrome c-type biogenesis protein CcsB
MTAMSPVSKFIAFIAGALLAASAHAYEAPATAQPAPRALSAIDKLPDTTAGVATAPDSPPINPISIPRAPFPPPNFDYTSLDRLIIQHGGRKKPFLTFALEVTREITGRATIRTSTGIRADARTFVTSLFLGQPEWARQPIVMIDYAPLKRELGLEVTQKHFSFVELINNPELPRLVGQLKAIRAREGTNARLDSLLKQVEMLGNRLDLFQALLSGSAFTIVPHPSQQDGTWVQIPAIETYYRQEVLGEFNKAISDLVIAFHRGESNRAFTTAAQSLIDAQVGLSPDKVPTTGRITVELIYDDLHPFRYAWIFYFLAACIFGATWKAGRNLGHWIGWSLVGIGLLFHIGAFIARIYISGRAPVTNMYETVVWVALGLLTFAIYYEIKYKSRIFILSALPLSVGFMIVADSLPVVLSPALNPLVAVLRDNFWLTTHVLMVTTSYAAFALAMAVGHVALFKQIITPGKQSVNPDILAYIYRAMQVGIIMLVFGVILGGVWAHYSWGRFWGWDPKETWSLIAALVYLAILHGRIAGWWSPFGFAVGAVLGFQSVIMAWYGVNFIIGAGLHSYGFGTGGQEWVAAFCILEVVLVSAALFRRYQRPSTASPA